MSLAESYFESSLELDFSKGFEILALWLRPYSLIFLVTLVFSSAKSMIICLVRASSHWLHFTTYELLN